MIRRASFWLPLLVAGTLAPAFSGCAGTTDGLFSDAGGAPSAGGTGAATAAGGTSSATAGSSSGGAHAGGVTGGMGAASGSSAHGGTSSSGGVGAASGSSSTGGSSSAGAGGKGGSNSGGKGGSNSGGSSSGGGGNAGSSSGGSAGSGGATCQDLLALAETELIAAQACDLARNAQQCTGSVSTVCGCQVPVEANDSAATRSYLATLKSFRDQHCTIACSKIACLPNLGAQCQPLDSGDRCVARVGATTQ